MHSETALLNGRRPQVSGALLRSGLWLRGGVIGAGTAILGVMLLASGEAEIGRALVMMAGGVLLAVYALRRSWRLLDAQDGAVEPANRPSPAAPAHALSFERSR